MQSTPTTDRTSAKLDPKKVPPPIFPKTPLIDPATATTSSPTKVMAQVVAELGNESAPARALAFQQRLDPLKIKPQYLLAGALVLIAYGWRTRVVGSLPTDRQVVVCCKHQWYEDTPLLGFAIMQELRQWANYLMRPWNKPVDRLLESLGGILVHRMHEVDKDSPINVNQKRKFRRSSMEDARSANDEAAEKAIKNLHRGIPLAAFVEGGLYPKRMNSVRISPNSTVGKVALSQSDNDLIAFVPASIKRSWGIFYTVSFGKPIYTKDCKTLQEQLTKDINHLWQK